MTSDSPLCIATSNAGKRVEFARILNLELEAVSLELDELQAIDPRVVCRHKAAQAWRALGRPVLVDDTALGLSALGGFPGALVRWVIVAGGPRLLHRMLLPDASPGAVATTVVGLADASGVHLFAGEVEGSVIDSPRGTNGFGFDAVFVPRGHSLTLSEMESALKDSLSPRGLALVRLQQHLATHGIRRLQP